MHLIVKDLQGEIIEEPKILNKDFSFSNVLGSGQSGLNLEIKSDSFDLVGKFIEFHHKDKKIYEGIVYDEKLNFNGITEIQTIGLFDLFNRKTTNIDYKTAQNDINYLINWINYHYPAYKLKFEASGSINYTRSGNSQGGAIIKDIVSKTGYDFFLGADRKVKFNKKISDKVHILNFGKNGDIESGYIGQNINNLINNSFYNNNGITDYIKDDNSINKFGEIFGYSNSFSNMQNKFSPYPLKKSQITLAYFDYNIQPGDYVIILNIPTKIENVKIVKVDYSLNSMTIFLDTFSNIYTNLKK